MTRRRIRVAGVVCAAALSACTSTAERTVATTVAPAPPPSTAFITIPPATTPRPGVDCPELHDGVHDTIVEGIPRSFVVRPAAGLGQTGGRATAPVVLLFHGFFGTAEGILGSSGLGTLGPAGGVTIVAPQGIGEPTNWHIGDDEYADAAFTDQILAMLHASVCVDDARIWLAGFSAGSAWAGVYGCAHPEGIEGLLMHSGLPPAICTAEATPNLIIAHGTADPLVPFDGGPQAVGDELVDLFPVPFSVGVWAATAGCLPDVGVSTVAGGSLTTYTGCAGDRTVVFQTADGLGHEWAGGTSAPAFLNPGCLLVERLAGSTDPMPACNRAAST